MLTVCCIKVGTKYDSEYVNQLMHDADTFLSGLPQFVCVTDDPTGISPDVTTVQAIPGLPGWWQKMALFMPQPFNWAIRSERILYLDLDVILTGYLDGIVQYSTEFAMHHDFHRPWKPASAVMVLDSGSRSWIWDHFCKVKDKVMMSMHGDQDYLYALQQQECVAQSPEQSGKPYCDFLPQKWIRSYKLHAREAPPPGSRVVCFHGKPKPAEITDGWVADWIAANAAI